MTTTHRSADVLVIGAGPAGIAAASVAAERGLQVIVLDENPGPGGQIWRESTVDPSPSPRRPDKSRQEAIARLQRSGAQLLNGRSVFDADASGMVKTLHESMDGSTVERFHYRSLILATGARERFLPFPGWTLPGVFGAGGLQALVRGGYSVAGERVIVSGTGPLLLAVAAHLAEDGAIVSHILEQAPMSRLAGFAASLLSEPAKLWQGARYRAAVWKAAYRAGSWVTQAIATPDGSKLCAVEITDGKQSWIEPCDLLACGYHLVPNTEVAALLGCKSQSSFVHVDESQRTSLPNIFCVGEPTGIAGLESAQIQGEIAGMACAGYSSAALQRKLSAARVFAAKLEKTFALRPEIAQMCQPNTIVCRCEDVTLGAIRSHTSWTDAKLQTRCGMGPCQARICGPAVEHLLGWRPASVRQPLYPVPLDSFAPPEDQEAIEHQSELIKENK